VIIEAIETPLPQLAGIDAIGIDLAEGRAAPFEEILGGVG
jgi:hypothetical protein